jgi:hypothetical protein
VVNSISAGSSDAAGGCAVGVVTTALGSIADAAWRASGLGAAGGEAPALVLSDALTAAAECNNGGTGPLRPASGSIPPQRKESPRLTITLENAKTVWLSVRAVAGVDWGSCSGRVAAARVGVGP